MDFSTTHAPCVRVTIDGTPYDVPRFLLPQFKAWVAERQKKSVDAAMEQIGDDPEARARFCLYWQPAPIDVAALIEDATTPEGVEYVLITCLKAAGLPDDKRAAILLADPGKLRTLARMLLSAEAAAAGMKAASDDPGVRGNPTPGQPPTSGGSPTTTPETSPSTSDASPAATPQP